jgi:hypothetical protein
VLDQQVYTVDVVFIDILGGIDVANENIIGLAEDVFVDGSITDYNRGDSRDGHDRKETGYQPGANIDDDSF